MMKMLIAGLALMLLLAGCAARQVACPVCGFEFNPSEHEVKR